MTKREEHLAQELDDFLTARLQGQALPPVDPSLHDTIRLADVLRRRIEAAEPDPLFLAHLEAQLNRAASRQVRTQTRSERGAFWRHITTRINEGFSMKRTVIAFGATMALAVIGYLAWFSWEGGFRPEPESIAVVGTTPAATATPSAPAGDTAGNGGDATPAPGPLPTLPSLGSAAGAGAGLGGGGGGGIGQTVAEGDEPILTDEIYIWNPLADAELELNAPFPTDPASLPVYTQPGYGILTEADVARLAAALGLSGPVYREVYPEPDLAAGDVPWTPPVVYFVFDGDKTLAVREDGFYYFDQATARNFTATLAPFAQGAPIAEAYLKATGLLNFPYEMTSPHGGDIEFRRVIDGRVTIFPEFMVSVTDRGEVMSVSYNALSQLSNAGNYPLRTAEEAWQHFVEQGLDYQQVTFISYPGPGYVQPEFPEPQPDPNAGLYKNWQRVYASGDRATLYPYPMVYAAVDGQAAPVINVDQYRLLGSEADLRAIAGYVGKQLRITGTVRETATRLTLELVSWEPVEQVDFVFRAGTVRRTENQVVIDADEGDTWLIVDAPADLADGERVYLGGWPGESPDPSLPAISWQYIDRIVEVESMPEEVSILPVEEDPYQIRRVVFDRIDLVYLFTPYWDQANERSEYVIQPAWRFTGLTDRNEIMEIYVQAVRQ